VSWKPASFYTANDRGDPHKVNGYTYRGLGLNMIVKGSPKGRRPPTWCLTHLGTGHAIARIKGLVAVAFPIAAEIAEAGDWDFLSLEGWRDRFPDARERVAEILAAHSVEAERWNTGNRSHEAAQAVAALQP
jgi:hypothetical protein